MPSWLLPLLGAAGPLLGGILARNATRRATDQIVGGFQNANQQIQKALGGPSLYQGYMNTGNQALGNLAQMKFNPINVTGPLSQMQWNPLNYGPLGGMVKR
jgi:hypothetical protein